MKIDLHKITIRKVIAGYKESAKEGGVTAYEGKLNIRPKYQREFVYKEKQRNAVIETIKNSFPLNVMYWMIRDDGGYEVLDGQQRTISVGQYVTGDFSFNDRFFHNLTKEEQDKILDYELMIYFCEGTDKERLDWFRIINIAGEKLTDQEIRNAVYTGPWLSDAKLKFSKTNCAAYLLANDGGQLVSGSPIRQEYLETALSWINEGKIEDYMAKHQHDKNADGLWNYFQDVIAWVRKTFPNYRREMNSVQWGELYNEFKDKKHDSKKLEAKVKELMQDEDVTKKSGIYPYVLTGQEKYLSIRAFTEKMKREAYERQNGICLFCKKQKKGKIKWDISEMEADHITPWHEGGKTIADNCQMLCKEHNRTKSGK
ncbi:MAG: HNH endonuclease [Candidatus Zambryskibacteria bacterium RIFCSPHIGHO2_01_FULL_43_25]|uniref:HNH endonuclease n=1 Tax=Candidatus Zambryskibacteria bacterium RIFCSPLOWO2_01_FULL_45_21 TaxID=1802761 RepID=A0A1G2U2G2_9BACT|nr:MAG: HNH endonuclease [Candidatus Zambryskibacteria bacterium RIFCSPHIGHO2_01_FULL_43_25]OHB00993.1 MAG: HNH endonuclease [Candidatus Zambryskibacteria bacterium RIFCSPHIGHO2_12_FULL_44_12b]OHB03711.1 MAG: HNH endonuclease [Candidatus Zambryskibacteria bacterium RIFCSPLOWO2_01_FULL_45_21]